MWTSSGLPPPLRKRACIRRASYEEAARLGKPFVALVTRPGVGRHAICVLEAASVRLLTLDPLSGTKETLTRVEFTAEWDPTILWVE